jgi:hypothetical protein
MSIQKLQLQNIAAAVAYTEYALVVPPRVNELTLQLRPGGSSGSATVANLFFYTTTTNGTVPGAATNLPQSPNTYNTIPVANIRTIRGLLGGQTIYFQVDQALQLLEVDYYGDI